MCRPSTPWRPRSQSEEQTAAGAASACSTRSLLPVSSWPSLPVSSWPSAAGTPGPTAQQHMEQEVEPSNLAHTRRATPYVARLTDECNRSVAFGLALGNVSDASTTVLLIRAVAPPRCLIEG